jgi:hypothetical protein
MLLRCVLSAVCVALVAPAVRLAARSSDDRHGTATVSNTSTRSTGRDTVPAVAAEALTKSVAAIRVDAPRVVTAQTPGDGKAQEPPLVVLEVPTITCPMVIVAADPDVDPKVGAPPPTDMTFTIRPVAPTACR